MYDETAISRPSSVRIYDPLLRAGNMTPGTFYLREDGTCTGRSAWPWHDQYGKTTLSNMVEVSVDSDTSRKITELYSKTDHVLFVQRLIRNKCGWSSNKQCVPCHNGLLVFRNATQSPGDLKPPFATTSARPDHVLAGKS